MKEKKAFAILLHLDVLRGPHSTGVATVSIDNKNKEHIRVYKELGVPHFLYNKYPKDFESDGEIKDFGLDVIMGHNRWATQGAITAENAHPFVFDNVVGAHNGTVLPYSLKSFAESDKYEIDSQKIYSQLNADNNLQTVWDKADGAMALVWWDSRDRRLHIARNKERSLFYTYSKDDSCIFWASESWMLSVALSRANIPHKEIKSVTEDTHYTFSVEYKQVQEWSSPLVPFSKVEVGGWEKYLDNWNGDDDWYEHISTGYNVNRKGGKLTGKLQINEFHHTGPQPWEGDFWGVTDKGKDICITTVGHRQKEFFDIINQNSEQGNTTYHYREYSAYNVNGLFKIHFSQVTDKEGEDMYGLRPVQSERTIFCGIGPQKSDLTKRQWLAATAVGCCVCGGSIPWSTHEHIEWVGDEPLCVECLGDTFVKDALKKSQEELVIDEA